MADIQELSKATLKSYIKNAKPMQKYYDGRAKRFDKKIHWDTDENPHGSDKGVEARKNSLKRIERKKASMKEDLEKLIYASAEAKPSVFSEAFDAIVKEKISARIEEMREDVSKTLFLENDNVRELTLHADNDEKIIKQHFKSKGLKHRITKDGEVHVHGEMPNSNKIGWWLYDNDKKNAVKRLTKEDTE